MKKILLGSFLIGIALIYSCKKSSTATTYDCTGITPTYTNNVKAIMDANCATSGCHSAGSKAAGKDFSSFNATSSNASSNSFMGSMQHLSGYSSMPKGASKLSDADLQTLYCWIQNGKPQ